MTTWQISITLLYEIWGNKHDTIWPKHDEQ